MPDMKKEVYATIKTVGNLYKYQRINVLKSVSIAQCACTTHHIIYVPNTEYVCQFCKHENVKFNERTNERMENKKNKRKLIAKNKI